MGKLIFFAIALICIQAASANLKCYQCTNNVLKPCKLSEAGPATCSGKGAACALEVPENASDKDLAIRKCVILDVHTGNYKCEPGFKCTHCTDELCNSPAPKLTPVTIISIILLTIGAYLF